MKNSTWRKCGTESVARDALGRNHTKDRAHQMITKLRDPANGFEIWRRFLEEWEPAYRGRYRAMLMQLLHFPFTGDRGRALEEWEGLVGQKRRRVQTRFRTRSKQQY